MKNEEKKELVRLACEGYIYESEDENFIIFSESTFDEYCEKRNDDLEEEFDYDLQEELNKMASKYFEEKGYEIYGQGGCYGNGQGRIEQVNAETAFIAIKENEFYKN